MTGTPGGRPPDPELGRWLDVARETWRAQLSTVRSSLRVARSAAGGELDTVAAARAYAQSARRGADRYWRDVSRLGADHALAVARLGQQVAVQVLDDVAAARRPNRGPSRSTPASTVTTSTTTTGSSTTTSDAAPTITLHGRVGERATGFITVANSHPRARRFDLSAGSVVDEHGADVVGATLELDPARTTVAAGGETTVLVGVELVPGLFAAGQQYLATVQVSGGEDATVVCTVVVDP